MDWGRKVQLRVTDAQLWDPCVKAGLLGFADGRDRGSRKRETNRGRLQGLGLGGWKKGGAIESSEGGQEEQRGGVQGAAEVQRNKGGSETCRAAFWEGLGAWADLLQAQELPALGCKDTAWVFAEQVRTSRLCTHVSL